jgi:DNA-binding transcriptional ArsR family regulator
MNEKTEKSVLIEYFGDHPIIRIIDFLLENRLFDYSKKQIAEGAGIGRPTLFKYWKKFEEMNIVKVSRVFGKTKLYKLNEENPIVKKIIELDLILADIASQKLIEEQRKKIAIEA